MANQKAIKTDKRPKPTQKKIYIYIKPKNQKRTKCPVLSSCRVSKYLLLKRFPRAGFWLPLPKSWCHSKEGWYLYLYLVFRELIIFLVFFFLYSYTFCNIFHQKCIRIFRFDYSCRVVPNSVLKFSTGSCVFFFSTVLWIRWAEDGGQGRWV